MTSRNGTHGTPGHTETLAQVYHRVSERLRSPVKVNAAAVCEKCLYLDSADPTVQDAVRRRDPNGKRGLMRDVACKCHLEQRRRADTLARRAAEAELPFVGYPRTLSNFDNRPVTTVMVEAATRFINLEGPRVLTIYGDPRIGKTHILEAIGRAWLAAGRTVHYQLTSDLLDRIRATFRPGGDDSNLYDLLRWYSSRSLLLLDDFGLAKNTGYAVEKLTSLVEQRLNSTRYLVVATNKSKSELSTNIDPVLASRLWNTDSRITSTQVVVCRAQSGQG